MSTPTTIAANAVPFAISSASPTTGYKNVVCKKTWSWTGDATLIQEETDCDVLTNVGAIKITFNFEWVLNTTPNGSTEWGSDDVANFFLNKTLIYVKTTNGTTFYRQIAGYISNYQESAPQGGMVTATGTFSGTGSMDSSL